MSDQRAGPYFRQFLEQVAEFRSDNEPVAADYKPIVQRFAGPSFGPRVLAVGEAAGQVKTTTGGGIYYGLLGAEIGAKVVHESFSRNRFDAQFLERYEERWKSMLDDEISSGYRYRKMYARLNDRHIEALFKFANSNGMIPLVRKRARFDWHADVLRAVSSYSLIPRILGGIMNAGR